MLNATFRPLESPLDAPRGGHRRAPFSASYTTTLNGLERELEHLKAQDIVVQIDVRREDIRNDGWPRSTATVKSPGVVVTFESKHGPLSYRCATYSNWEMNLRAIALTLERLRAVDRYGAVKGGEQYKGWARLPPGTNGHAPIAAGEWANAERAADWLISQTSLTMDPAHVLGNPANLTLAYREANRAKDFIEKHR